MGEGNQTFVLEFTLLGLSQDPKIQILLFCVFLIIYLLSVFGNLLIIILIQTDPRLHTPMYFFLKNLSFVDLFLYRHRSPSVGPLPCEKENCFRCWVLTTDSRLPPSSVHRPLHYSTLMTQRVCVQLATVCWISGAFVRSVDSAFTLCLPCQGQNISNHYFCEPPELLKLASADTYSAEVALFSMGVIVLLAPVSLILASYWHIISTVIRMQSGEGRLKVFSTCSSHLTVVALYYGSGIFAYMRPNSKTMNERDKVISLFYSVMTSMLNPIIYSLRNKDVKGALSKLAGR
ncbi:hypothetical protein FD754_016112 [Muntiacus muntjak]|uniref:G-protein coupled receptors family 1 profile domain-containing protein n=1 Tax=Muntiacus muntjak TaxID=9888 RepID=A0A5N3VSB7_MUNMU|nr:hypothetical protein FD754_016112 [Muntiacus muntjak]